MARQVANLETPAEAQEEADDSLESRLMNLMSCDSTWRKEIHRNGGLEDDCRDEEVSFISMWSHTGDVMAMIKQGGKRGRLFTLTIPPEAIRLLYLEWYEPQRPVWEQARWRTKSGSGTRKYSGSRTPIASCETPRG
jgi:hypothetical protein